MQSSSQPKSSTLPFASCKHWASACQHCCVFRHLFQPQLCTDSQYHVAVVWSYIHTPKYTPPITTFGSNSKECLAVAVVKDLSSLVVKKFVRAGYHQRRHVVQRFRIIHVHSEGCNDVSWTGKNGKKKAINSYHTVKLKKCSVSSVLKTQLSPTGIHFSNKMLNFVSHSSN